MDLDNISDRLSTVEQAIGVNERSDTNSADCDIYAVRNKFFTKGFTKANKVPLEQLKKLRDVVSQPENRPLSEKIMTIQCTEDLIRQRAELLADIHERTPIVLDTEKLASVAALEPQLESNAGELMETLRIIAQNKQEVDEFKKNYFLMMGLIRERISEMENTIVQAEEKRDQTEQEA